MSSFLLRLPQELQDQASAQADAAGVSLNEYIVTALAVRIGAQAEAERYLAARGGRATPGTARAILTRAGRQSAGVRPEDRIAEDAP